MAERNRIRLLSVIHYPVFGGPHNRNLRLAPLLAERGVELQVLLPLEPGNAAERFRDAGVPMEQIPLRRLRLSRDPRVQARLAAGLIPEINAIRKLIRQRRIDAVLINGLINPHAGIAARLEGIPVIWQILDTFPRMTLRRISMISVRRCADVLMCTGRRVAEEHPGAVAFGPRLVLFFPPVDTEAVRPDSGARAAARRELGLAAEDLVIGNIGNLNPMKGHLTFIRAAAELRKRVPDARFVILGAEYSYRSDYTNALWFEAKEAGFQLGTDLIVRDPASMASHLAAAFDIFWLSAEPRSEGIPTAVGEAMALGLPVVATDVGSVREAVTTDLTGYVVPPRDPAAIARATLAILDRPEVRASMSREARSLAVQRFGIGSCAERHLDALDLAMVEHGELTTMRDQAIPPSTMSR